MGQRFGTFILALWLSAMLVGCGGIAPSGQPASTPGGVVVTVRVADAEEYRIRLTDLDDIGIAQKLPAGESAPRIPNGRVVRGEPDVNVGYSWHIDPDSVEFADTAIEVCDGRPSDVEKRVITSDRYCPWSAQLVAITPAESRSGAGAGPAEIRPKIGNKHIERIRKRKRGVGTRPLLSSHCQAGMHAPHLRLGERRLNTVL